MSNASRPLTVRRHPTIRHLWQVLRDDHDVALAHAPSRAEAELIAQGIAHREGIDVLVDDGPDRRTA
ncbi:MAG TPA: hypothetical protein VKA86_18935 [Candidatus Krumholzibacteria bacterium]|nr:hypothetical protein [Candidatus Krumholzibacteria bacterium]